jgi:PadR family transcriptional regulator AphA
LAGVADGTRVGTRRRAAAPADPLSMAEEVCLALIAEGRTHGWQLGTLLAPDGEVGRIWHLSRPLTYRAVEQLVVRRLVRRQAATGATGARERQLLTATAAGRAHARRWITTPVEHLRDVRTELLVKLALVERAGGDRAALLAAQEAAFADTIDSLVAPGPDDGDLVRLWRRESARAVRRFLDAARRPAGPPPAPLPLVRLSARNQLEATVVEVLTGDVMATVRATLSDGQVVTAVITRASVQDLDLAAGDRVLVVVKSTEVLVAKP